MGQASELVDAPRGLEGVAGRGADGALERVQTSVRYTSLAVSVALETSVTSSPITYGIAADIRNG